MKTTLLTAALMLAAMGSAIAQNKKTDTRKVSTTEVRKGETTKYDDVDPVRTNPTVRPDDNRVSQPPERGDTDNRTRERTTSPDTRRVKPTVGRDNTDIYEEDPSHVIQNVGDNGQVNWTDSYIEARGKSAMDTSRFKVPGQAQLMAEEGARADAYRRLLETIQGVHVVGETTVKDMITQSDYVYKRVDGIVKGASQVGVPMANGNIVEVVLRVPLYGDKGISSAIPQQEVEKQLKKSYGGRFGKMEESPSPEPIADSKPLVFTIKGKQYDPTLFPIMVDEEGKVLFDFSKLVNDGSVPKYLRATQNLLKDIGFTEGAEVVELVSNGKGEYTLPKEIQRKLGWMKAVNIVGGIVKFVVDIIK